MPMPENPYAGAEEIYRRVRDRSATPEDIRRLWLLAHRFVDEGPSEANQRASARIRKKIEAAEAGEKVEYDEEDRAFLLQALGETAVFRALEDHNALEVVLSPELTVEQQKLALGVIGELFAGAGGLFGLKVDGLQDLPEPSREFSS